MQKDVDNDKERKAKSKRNQFKPSCKMAIAFASSIIIIILISQWANQNSFFLVRELFDVDIKNASIYPLVSPTPDSNKQTSTCQGQQN